MINVKGNGIARLVGASRRGAKKKFGVLDALPAYLRSQRSVQFEDVEVRFATTDLHSKRWFLSIPRHGLHEPVLSAAIVRIARAANAFADIGAHLGYFSCLAGAANPHLKIFTFEMDQRLSNRIAVNAAMNDLRRIEVVPKAVSDRATTVYYPARREDPGLQMTDAPPPEQDVAACDAVTLDDFFRERRPVPDFMKIDVEGAEMKVLRGGENLLREHLPTLFLEIHPQKLLRIGSSAEEVHDLLRDIGYKMFGLRSRIDQNKFFKVERGTDILQNAYMIVCSRGDMIPATDDLTLDTLVHRLSSRGGQPNLH